MFFSSLVAYISIICKFGFIVLKFDFFKEWILTNTNYEYFTIHYRYNIPSNTFQANNIPIDQLSYLLGLQSSLARPISRLRVRIDKHFTMSEITFLRWGGLNVA